MPVPAKKRKSSDLSGLFREIFFSSDEKNIPFGMTFVYSPENFEQKKLGTVFGVVKISDTSPDSSYVANLLASVIKKEYFSKPDRPPADAFEASLRKANLALSELAREGSVKWIGKLNFAGGALEKNNLHFSKIGTTAILLLRNGAVADIGDGADDELPAPDSHPLKTFSDISSGKIDQGDCLIFTTSDLLEIFSLEEIRQHGRNFPREEFQGILSASLTANSDLSGAIVVNVVPEEEALGAIPKENFALQSVPRAAEQKIPARPGHISHMDMPPNRVFSSPEAKSSGSIYISESDEITSQKSFWEKILSALKKISAGGKNTAIFFWKKIASFFRNINWRKIFSALGSAILFAIRSFKKIDWRKRSVRIGAAAGGAIALAVVLLLIFRSPASENSPAIGTSPAPAENLDSVPAAVSEDTNAKKIENVSEVAPLPPGAREPVLLGDSLFALAEEKSILKISLSNGEVKKVDSDIAGGKFVLAAAMPDLGTIFILTADKKVISFTPSNERFQENNISFPDNFNATDAKTYLTYAYFLDSAANQIYRYPRAEGGFGDRQDWLKFGADVKAATGFAINEDLFAASRNQITAYLQGKKNESLNFENPNVPLAIDKIYTAPDFENIYVLDNKNRRVTAFSKDGKIAAQYWNASIAGIKDFTVDEKNKLVYIQKNDSLQKFSLE